MTRSSRRLAVGLAIVLAAFVASRGPNVVPHSVQLFR